MDSGKPTCGKCGKEVAQADVLCPHCGVLLAAYTSPGGSSDAPISYEVAEPVDTAVQKIDITVPEPPPPPDYARPPETIEPVSTAPKPIFATTLTVEDIKLSAEGNHTDTLVTIADPDAVPTKPVTFDVPDYARPPENAAPLPEISAEELGIDLDDLPTSYRDDEEGTPDPKVPGKVDREETEQSHAGESWLYDVKPAPTARRQPAPEPAGVEQPEAVDQHQATTNSGGVTENYLQRLHQQASYSAANGPRSQPVEQISGRMSPAERAANRRARDAARQRRAMLESTSSHTSIANALSLLAFGCLAIMWLITIISLVSGSFSSGLIFITLVLTMGFKPLMRLIRNINWE